METIMYYLKKWFRDLIIDFFAAIPFLFTLLVLWAGYSFGTVSYDEIFGPTKAVAQTAEVKDKDDLKVTTYPGSTGALSAPSLQKDMSITTGTPIIGSLKTEHPLEITLKSKHYKATTPFWITPSKAGDGFGANQVSFTARRVEDDAMVRVYCVPDCDLVIEELIQEKKNEAK